MYTFGIGMDWTLLKSFLSVVEHGSLSKAALALGVTQPSVSRHIKSLEEQLGHPLFQRHSEGLTLTDAGQSVLPSAYRLKDAVAELELSFKGLDAPLQGTVRITASQFVAHYLLPEVLAEIRGQLPDIELELVASDAAQNLLFGEADIAIRMAPSHQLDIIVKRLGKVELGIFASTAYLDRNGHPATLEDLQSFDMVGFDRDERILEAMKALGWSAERSWFSTRCDDHPTHLMLIKEGLGIGFVQTKIAQKDPTLVQLFPDYDLPALDVSLAAHEKMLRVPRVRAVWERLEIGLRPALR